LSAVSSTTLSGLLLATQFEYPDILRRPTDEVLERFAAGGAFLILVWWTFAMTAVVLAPTVVLLSHEIGDANAALVVVATTVGVLAAAVQFLGLIRRPFPVPYLARTAAEPCIAIGAALMVCSLEFVGAFEVEGWNLAGALTPVVYIAWSGWLAAIGLALLV
jgi:hypothetical protein